MRIEDTDRERSSAANERAILEALAWLGMEPDAQPVRQSENLAKYQAAAQRLLEEGKAYKCFATAEELAALRAAQERAGEKPRYDRRWRERDDHPAGKPHCLRFKTPLEGECAINDLLRGTVAVANREFDDPVILRTDGTATYNFAAVVDDIAMEISHVIRGEDHLTNTLRQVHIYAALAGQVPEFAHLPLILGAKRDARDEPVCNEKGEQVYERLSKRNAVVDIDHYRRDFLPEAMVNYLAQLGWTQPTGEIYSPGELVAAFELDRVNRSAARFDLARLQWINQRHLRGCEPARLARLAGLDAPPEAIAIAVEKASTISQLKEELKWLDEPSGLEPTLLGKLDESNREAFVALCHALAGLDAIEAKQVKGMVADACAQAGLKFPQLGMPLRVALTGRTSSPEVGRVAQVLGVARCRKRLAAAVALVG